MIMPQPQMRLRASHLGFTSLKQLNLDPDQTPEEGGEPQHDQAEGRRTTSPLLPTPAETPQGIRGGMTSRVWLPSLKAWPQSCLWSL